MDEEVIQILLVEDSDADALLVTESLSQSLSPSFEISQCRFLRQVPQLLRQKDFELMLLDLTLPDATGLETVEKARQFAPALPIVVLTGLDDESLGMKAVEAGAQDYLVKGQSEFWLLPRAVRYALARHKAERAVRESEGRYRSLFEHNLAGLFRATSDGVILACNNAFARMLGYNRPQDTPTMLPDLLMDAAQWPVLLERLKMGSLPGVELQLRNKNGSPVFALANIAAVSGVTESERLIEGSILDITARKRLEQRLLESQKMEAIGRLAGGVAHDFNNLLTVITGYAEILEQSPDIDSESQSALLEIKTAAERAAALTQQLLAFSRKQILAPQRLDLNELLTALGPTLRNAAGSHIEVVISKDRESSPLRADRAQIQQILLNLTVNARDAMPQGGRLLIETAQVELQPDERLPEGLSPGSYVQLKVTDTGVGMDPETMSRIFEPFFTTKQFGASPGLGLATVYGIVAQSGGAIQVDSKVGRGTTFTIFFPRADRVDLAGGLRKPGRGSETILLVEDDDAIRKLARSVLISRGYRVLDAPNATDALRIAQTQAEIIDLLLTDVVMPGMAGGDLADAVLDAQPQAKVLLMSGYTNSQLVQQQLMRFELAFIQKPFTPDALVRKIRQVLSGTAEVRTAEC